MVWIHWNLWKKWKKIVGFTIQTENVLVQYSKVCQNVINSPFQIIIFKSKTVSQVCSNLWDLDSKIKIILLFIIKLVLLLYIILVCVIIRPLLHQVTFYQSFHPRNRWPAECDRKPWTLELYISIWEPEKSFHIAKLRMTFCRFDRKQRKVLRFYKVNYLWNANHHGPSLLPYLGTLTQRKEWRMVSTCPALSCLNVQQQMTWPTLVL